MPVTQLHFSHRHYIHRQTQFKVMEQGFYFILFFFTLIKTIYNLEV